MSQQERVIVVLNDACLLGLAISHEAGEIPRRLRLYSLNPSEDRKSNEQAFDDRIQVRHTP